MSDQSLTHEEFTRRVAELFDGRHDYDEGTLHPHLAKRLIDAVQPRHGQKVLDIATGTGLVATAAAKAVGPTGRVVGVDISAGMLALAERKVSSERLGNVELIHADAEKLDYPAETFDLILCCSALPFLNDQLAALRHWHRFLTDGGTIGFTAFSDTSFITGVVLQEVAEKHGVRITYRNEQTGTPERCEKLLRDAGFAVVQVVDEQLSDFVPLDRAESDWSGTLKHPMSYPLTTLSTEQLDCIRSDFLAELRSRAAEGRIWNEVTVYYATGRKA